MVRVENLGPEDVVDGDKMLSLYFAFLGFAKMLIIDILFNNKVDYFA